MDNLQYHGSEIDQYINKKVSDEKYADTEYGYITDIQRFDKFLMQFGIDISKFEKITLDEAKSLVENYNFSIKNQIIREYLNFQNKPFYIAMSEIRKNNMLGKVITAIKEGTFELSDETVKLFGLKKIPFFKRLGKNAIIPPPKSDPIKGRGLKPKKEDEHLQKGKKTPEFLKLIEVNGSQKPPHGVSNSTKPTPPDVGDDDLDI